MVTLHVNGNTAAIPRAEEWLWDASLHLICPICLTQVLWDQVDWADWLLDSSCTIFEVVFAAMIWMEWYALTPAKQP